MYKIIIVIFISFTIIGCQKKNSSKLDIKLEEFKEFAKEELEDYPKELKYILDNSDTLSGAEYEEERHGLIYDQKYQQFCENTDSSDVYLSNVKFGFIISNASESDNPYEKFDVFCTQGSKKLSDYNKYNNDLLGLVRFMMAIDKKCERFKKRIFQEVETKLKNDFILHCQIASLSSDNSGITKKSQKTISKYLKLDTTHFDLFFSADDDFIDSWDPLFDYSLYTDNLKVIDNNKVTYDVFLLPVRFVSRSLDFIKVNRRKEFLNELNNSTIRDKKDKIIDIVFDEPIDSEFKTPNWFFFNENLRIIFTIELDRENFKYLIPAGSVLITDIKDTKGSPIPYNYFIKKNGKYYGADKWVSVLNLK